MSAQAWELLATPQEVEDSAWELFHENSKITHYDRAMTEAAASAYLAQIPEALPFDGLPQVKLPESGLPPVLLAEAMARSAEARELEQGSIPVEAAAALLRYACGAAGGAGEGERRRRSVVSEGLLFPLELFVHSSRVAGLAPGLYHYSSPGNSLRLLRAGDHSQKFAAALLNAQWAQAAALTVFIAAIPERSVFRYGDRGYRFVLLEAGGVLQNLNLAAAALDLACANTGEFCDGEIDDVLDFDGLSISALYVVGVGKASSNANK